MMNKRSKELRRKTIELSKANGGYHYGGCFSIVEILIALFEYVLHASDRFILSKGHACWPYYVLLREMGYSPRLEGHPVRDPNNMVYCSTGSLGHGFPTGIGIAMAKKIKGVDGMVYVLMGDGECQEGTTWESMLIASQQSLGNLVVIVDWNKIQGSGFVKDILSVDGLDEVAVAIGWRTYSIDGHSIADLRETFSNIRSIYKSTTCPTPTLVIAHTVKGKGISFMENKPEWHAKWPNKEEEAQALQELS